MEARASTSRTPSPHPVGLGPLVRRVADGEEAALAELYDASSPFVYGLALRILTDAAAAEEVTLDVFTKRGSKPTGSTQPAAEPTPGC